MSYHIWHDTSGEVVAVGQVVAEGIGAEAIPSDGLEILIVEENDLDDDALKTIGSTHRVDIEQGKLVRKSA